MIAVIAVIINGLLKLTEPVAVLLNNKLLCNPFPKSRRGVFYDFIGLVKGCCNDSNEIEVEMRNQVAKGDYIDIIDPKKDEINTVMIMDIRKEDGEKLSSAHNSYHVFLKTDKAVYVNSGAVLRRKI